jgi:hypothetical protein
MTRTLTDCDEVAGREEKGRREGPLSRLIWGRKEEGGKQLAFVKTEQATKLRPRRERSGRHGRVAVTDDRQD